MARLKRSSSVLDKAERRIAGMRSISDFLEFGDGLNLVEYDTRIQGLQGQVSEYNTMLSRLDEMMGRILQSERELSSYSEKMLMSVGTRYGKDSLQYVQAGGKPRKNAKRQLVSVTPTSQIAPVTEMSTTTNGNGTKATVN